VERKKYGEETIMRVKIVMLGLAMAVLPTVAMAQQQTCEQRLAVMGQLVEDMNRARATVSTAEVEAASLKVQNKELQGQLDALKKSVEKK
jgi:hypothetical protein